MNVIRARQLLRLNGIYPVSYERLDKVYEEINAEFTDYLKSSLQHLVNSSVTRDEIKEAYITLLKDLNYRELKRKQRKQAVDENISDEVRRIRTTILNKITFGLNTIKKSSIETSLVTSYFSRDKLQKLYEKYRQKYIDLCNKQIGKIEFLNDEKSIKIEGNYFYEKANQIKQDLTKKLSCYFKEVFPNENYNKENLFDSLVNSMDIELLFQGFINKSLCIISEIKNENFKKYVYNLNKIITKIKENLQIDYLYNEEYIKKLVNDYSKSFNENGLNKLKEFQEEAEQLLKQMKVINQVKDEIISILKTTLALNKTNEILTLKILDYIEIVKNSNSLKETKEIQKFVNKYLALNKLPYSPFQFKNNKIDAITQMLLPGTGIQIDSYNFNNLTGRIVVANRKFYLKEVEEKNVISVLKSFVKNDDSVNNELTRIDVVLSVYKCNLLIHKNLFGKITVELEKYVPEIKQFIKIISISSTSVEDAMFLLESSLSELDTQEELGNYIQHQTIPVRESANNVLVRKR